METLLKRAADFPDWDKFPIPGFQIGTGGLIALADLSTIAQRTAIAGGSSWLDALLLAPGLHYQQAADALTDESQKYDAVEQLQGKTSTYSITNSATIRYLQRVGQLGGVVTVDVGMIPQRDYLRRGRRAQRRRGQRSIIWRDYDAELGWYSHVLYLMSPVLTIASIVLLVLLQEWWGIVLLGLLMLSRVMNIWVIKRRSETARAPSPPPPPSPDVSHLLTQWLVDLGNGRSVCLRGMADDLQAITTSTWLRAKTHVDGYLEAAAKLLVFLVAAFSGNMSQAGNFVFMGLLLVTAGLLGLSNAHARTFRMHGRLAAPTSERLPYPPERPPYPHSRETTFGSSGSVSYPTTTLRTDTGLSVMSDFAERGQIGAPIQSSHPFERHVSYS